MQNPSYQPILLITQLKVTYIQLKNSLKLFDISDYSYIVAFIKHNNSNICFRRDKDYFIIIILNNILKIYF
jgi:hypothetical protein